MRRVCAHTVGGNFSFSEAFYEKSEAVMGDPRHYGRSGNSRRGGCCDLEQSAGEALAVVQKGGKNPFPHRLYATVHRNCGSGAVRVDGIAFFVFFSASCFPCMLWRITETITARIPFAFGSAPRKKWIFAYKLLVMKGAQTVQIKYRQASCAKARFRSDQRSVRLPQTGREP